MNSSNYDLEFKVNPLDVNIVGMLINIVKYLKSVFDGEEEFETHTENFLCKDPTLDRSDVILTCRKADDQNGGEDILEFECLCRKRNTPEEINEVLFVGGIEEMKEYLDSKDAFKDIKSMARYWERRR